MPAVTHKMASDSLQDLIKAILARPQYKYLPRVHIDPYEGDKRIKYTIVLESKTHRCIEVRRFAANFKVDNFIEECSYNIIQMESALAKTEKQAAPKTFLDMM